MLKIWKMEKRGKVIHVVTISIQALLIFGIFPFIPFQEGECSSCMQQKIKNSNILEYVDDNIMLSCNRKIYDIALLFNFYILQSISSPKQFRATFTALWQIARDWVSGWSFTLGLSVCQPDGHLTMLSPVPTVTKHFDCIPLLGKNILASTFIIGLFLYKLYYYQSAD